MRLSCVALLLLPWLAAAFLQHAPAPSDNTRQLPQPPHMLLAAARNSRVAASPKLAVKQLGVAASKSKRAAVGATAAAAAAAPKAADATKAKLTADTSKRKAAAKIGAASKAKAASSAVNSLVKKTAPAEKAPTVRATTAKSTVDNSRGLAANDRFQQLEALFHQADTKSKPERALASSTAHLLLQLLTTGLKVDHTKLLRDLLLELLYTVNKMLKKVEHMPDHGLFVRVENSK